MILVTGATGLLGNTIVRRLLAGGERVRVLARAPFATRALAELRVEIVVGDITDRMVVARAIDGASLAIHAAALVRIGRRDLEELRRVNVGGTDTIVDACMNARVRLLHVSSVDALGWGTTARPGTEDAPLTPDYGIAYVRTKRESQRLVLAAVERGLDATIVNPGFLLGPWDWRPSSGRLLIEAIRKPWLPAPPGGNDFCHADDVASGVLAAAARGRRGACYILGGQALSYADAFRAFRRAAGKRPQAWSLPRLVIEIAGRAGDAAGWLFGREPELNSGAIAASSHPHHFDDMRARRELGYVSRDISATAADAVRWFQAEGYLA